MAEIKTPKDFCVPESLIRSNYYSDTYRASFTIGQVKGEWDIQHISIPFSASREEEYRRRFGVTQSGMKAVYGQLANAVTRQIKTPGELRKSAADPAVPENTKNRVDTSTIFYAWRTVKRRADEDGVDAYLVSKPHQPLVGTAFTEERTTLSNVLFMGVQMFQTIKSYNGAGYSVGSVDLSSMYAEKSGKTTLIKNGYFLHGSKVGERVIYSPDAAVFGKPSLLSGEEPPSFDTDVYALCGLLWTLLSGNHYTTPPDFGVLPKYAPDGLADAMLKAMDSDNSNKSELNRALRDCLKSVRDGETPNTEILFAPPVWNSYPLVEDNAGNPPVGAEGLGEKVDEPPEIVAADADTGAESEPSEQSEPETANPEVVVAVPSKKQLKAEERAKRQEEKAAAERARSEEREQAKADREQRRAEKERRKTEAAEAEEQRKREAEERRRRERAEAEQKRQEERAAREQARADAENAKREQRGAEDAERRRRKEETAERKKAEAEAREQAKREAAEAEAQRKAEAAERKRARIEERQAEHEAIRKAKVEGRIERERSGRGLSNTGAIILIGLAIVIGLLLLLVGGFMSGRFGNGVGANIAPTPTMTATPEPTREPTPSPTPVPSPTPTPTLTPSPSPTATPTPTPAPTPVPQQPQQNWSGQGGQGGWVEITPEPAAPAPRPNWSTSPASGSVVSVGIGGATAFSAVDYPTDYEGYGVQIRAASSDESVATVSPLNMSPDQFSIVGVGPGMCTITMYFYTGVNDVIHTESIDVIVE